MNMMRKSVAAMLCLGVLALSANTAQATGGSSFAKCLRTPLAHFPGTIADAAAQTEDLSILYDLVVKAGLGGALSDPNAELTVYAPTNAAFLAIPELIRNAIVADDDALTAVLTYHVTPGEVDPRRTFIPYEVSTLQGQTVFFNRGKVGPQVNQSNINCQGVQTTNGLVWIIDSVLQPQYF
ncbi:MAG: fasciclin domain-containing protein [Candidatus Competibacter sp.]|nr:fasciclin domain-containing protein [Candidatus Competibacter sp.]